MIRCHVSNFVLLLFALGSCGNLFQSDPNLIMMDFHYLSRVNKGISEKSPTYLPAYNRLCKEAENALLKNYSFFLSGQNVILKSTIRTNFSGEEIPFAEIRSGEIHPKQTGGKYHNSIKTAGSDNSRYFLEMTSDISTLTLAWFFSKDERYAGKASELIRNWFLNAELNIDNQDDEFPNALQYNAISLLDAKGYIDVIDAVAILETSDSWNKRDTGKIKRWFSDYLQWLLVSEAGLYEKSQMNFRGTWFDVQLAGYALFAGNTEIVKQVIEYSIVRRIPGQFDGTGLQKFELSSIESYNNSCINLEGYLVLGKIADHAGIDFWNDPFMPIHIIQAACDFVFGFIGRFDQWPYSQSGPVDFARLVKIVIESKKILKNSEYEKKLEMLKPEIKSNSRLIILNYS